MGPRDDVNFDARRQAEGELSRSLDDAVRSAERSAALARVIFQSAGDGIIGTDEDSTILMANQAAAELLGGSPEELVGRTLHEVAHHSRPDGSPYPVADCPIHRAIGQGWSMPVHEDVFWRRDGERLAVELTVTSLPERLHGVGAVTVFRDIHHRHEMQRLKDQFVGVVSHELRTPLASIIGSLSLLSAGAVGSVTDRQRDLVDMATRNAKRLGALVDDILDMDRLEAGRMPLVPTRTAVGDLVRGVVDALQGSAATGHVTLAAEPHQADCVVEVDAGRMSQALTNLVGNALKFTPPLGRVTLKLREVGPEIRIEVEDTGPGIEPGDLAKIFERFRQVGSGPQQRRGSGLGLAITQGIVEGSGGRVEVASTVGEGSVFAIVLPRLVPEEVPS